MNKLFRKLFTPIAIFAMALGVSISINNHTEVVGAKAASTTTTLTFPKLTSDSSTAFTSTTISTSNGGLKDTPNGAFIETTTATDKVYGGTNGFKYGSSSAVGNWSFTTKKNVTKIVAVFNKYGSDSSSKGKITSLEDSKSATSEVISGATTLTLDNISSKSFTIEALVKRLYLTSIEFTHEADVSGIPVTGVTISPKTLDLIAGGSTGLLNATVEPNDATDKTGVFQSSNTQVATVSSTGVVTPLKQGVATITFTTNSGGHTDTALVNVGFANLNSISLNKNTEELILGSNETFVVTANPITASNLVTWSSDNELVATVSEGKVTALSLGTATITATSIQDSSKKASILITVIPVPDYSHFKKITSVDDLYFGATYIIANNDGTKTLSKTANANNIPSVSTTMESESIIDSNEIMKITLEIGKVKDTFAFKTVSSDSDYDEKYLFAASSSSNYLRTQEAKDANSSWKISFTNSVPLIVAQGSNSRNTMQYNSSNDLFAAYASNTQGQISLYLDESTVDDTLSANMFISEVNSGQGAKSEGKCEEVYEFLNSVYERLSFGAKTIVDSSSDSSFVDARARMSYLSSWVSANNSSNRTHRKVNDKNDLLSIITIGAIGLTSILGYYFINKKKQLD